MVFEHEKEYESQWSAINSIAAKIGCSAETLRKWVRQANPARVLKRIQRDRQLSEQIRQVWEENFCLYGARKV